MAHLKFLSTALLYTWLIMLIGVFDLHSQSALDSIKAMVSDMQYSDSLRADKAQRLANYYIGRNEDSARHYNQWALEIAQRTSYQELVLDIKLGELDINRNTWSFDTLDERYTKLLAEAQEENYQKLHLSGLISHSALYMNRGFSEKGIEILLKAIPIAEALEDYSQLGKTQYNIGGSYANMGMNELAIERLRDAYQSFVKAEQKEFALFTLNAIANNFNNLDQRDSAFHYLNRILPVADSIDYTRLQVGARSTYGAMLLSDKKYEEAKAMFDQALPIAEKMGNTLTLANCRCNLGRVNYYLGNYEEALLHLNKAYSYEIFKDNILSNHFCLKEMAMTQQKLGNYKLSNHYFEKYVQYQDTVLIKENKFVVAELEAKYESTIKEAEIQKQEAAINQRTYQRNLLFGGLGLSLMLGGSFIWGLFSRNKRNKKIAAQDKDLQIQKIKTLEKEKKLLSMSSLLEGQENERIRIAKDLHDGLGGLLTNVKAHFGKIQAEIENLENLDIYRTANQMIDKAHDEVRRISHNLMPADLRVGGLPVAVRQLVHELRTIHELKTDFELVGFNGSRLDEKIELSAYRIIQELINNMLKYASASKAFIQLSKFESELQIVVEDDGVGFDYEEGLASSDGMGLKSIQSRIDQLDGQIDVVTSLGKGTSLTINLPL